MNEQSSSHVKVTLHDGASIDVYTEGAGPVVMLPVNPLPAEGPKADEMRAWGADPELGRSLVNGLRDAFRVVAFDYEGHVLSTPKADTLTPEQITRDFLAIADAVGVDQFAYYGYSWLAVAGMQLALRTDRLTALMMGGYSPLDGPYEEMLRVTRATHALAVAQQQRPPKPASEQKPTQDPAEIDWSTVEMTLSEPQTRQFVTLYEALRHFNDREVQARITCPRLCFVGSKDEITYGERWGDVHITIAQPFLEKQAELEGFGWDVRILPDLDHMQAMQAQQVLSLIRPWLLLRLRP